MPKSANKNTDLVRMSVYLTQDQYNEIYQAAIDANCLKPGGKPNLAAFIRQIIADHIGMDNPISIGRKTIKKSPTES